MQETKYKAGDKVLIRPDLKEGVYYAMQGGRTLVANNDMSRNYAGRVVSIDRFRRKIKIRKINQFSYYIKINFIKRRKYI